MKKVAGIVLGVIAAIIVAAISIYYIRDYQAKRQLVHKHSTSFLILSIDELLIDNIVPLLRTASNDTLNTGRAKSQFLKDVWHTGLAIPAKLLLFSLPKDPGIFYSIHQIKDIEDWSRFVNNYSESGPPQQSTDSNTFRRLHRYIQVATKGDRVVFRFGATDADWTDEAYALLDPSENLVALTQLESYRHVAKKGHMTYWQSDGQLAVTAELADQKLTIDGHGRLGKKIQSGPYSVRKMNSEKTAIAFWSRLPIQATPIIEATIARFADGLTTGLFQTPPNYVDLLVSKELVLQRDSIVTYEYDDDFNPIETTTVQTLEVPRIESLWKGGADLDKQLPDQFFYTLHRYREADAVMLTTQEGSPQPLHYEQNPYMFMLRLNMVNWPANWMTAALRRLQRARFMATLSAIPNGDDAVTIGGEIVSDESLLSLF
ncbi:hypothetical protein [Sphingobacterium paludis]|uniref:Uncharacterized protein n=1 Tax=Sphingobacterium paludis TaxID=1476465 RepID=A0A4R7D8J0_9SPHI|nr:hypothetical protein [Sphingobacterium paludis]TDS17583.1 hypothetical protein B0I21_101450 [Sphingobacterium paludis]